MNLPLIALVNERVGSTRRIPSRIYASVQPANTGAGGQTAAIFSELLGHVRFRLILLRFETLLFAFAPTDRKMLILGPIVLVHSAREMAERVIAENIMLGGIQSPFSSVQAVARRTRLPPFCRSGR